MFVPSRIAVLGSALALLSHVQASAFQRRNTSGCGTQHDFVGETKEFTVESSGGARIYRVHLPLNYDPNVQMSLLIAYHGRGVEPTDYEAETQFSNPDVNPDMITVYPTGYGLTWEGPSYAEPDVSDLQFTTDLVNRLKNDFCIDESRLYATGHSNGGGFVNTLACSAEHGGQFAGFASVSAALYTDLVGNEGCAPARSPLPIFEAHGTADETIPYDGGDGAGGPLPSIPEWLGRWAERNKCNPPESNDLPNGVVDEAFTCAGAPGLQRHVRMEEHDHTYPAGEDPQIFISPLIIEYLSAQGHP